MMQQYKDLLLNVLRNGENRENRTGIDTLSIPAAMMQFDLRKGFPAMTTKRLAFNQVKGELIGFLRGYTSAADFRALGCTIWDQNANENAAWLANPWRMGDDDLGRLGYSHGWRNFGGSRADMNGFDQIAQALHTLRTAPESRRILVTAWNPTDIGSAALPPCHVLFKLMPNPRTRVLHLSYYQRSCDLFLGVPFNIASYAILLELFAAWSGYTPGILTAHMDDVHLYANHLAQVEVQLHREVIPPPTLLLSSEQFDSHASVDDLVEWLTPSTINLVGYLSHAAIKAPMAV
jgi:thymidylate synthase